MSEYQSPQSNQPYVEKENTNTGAKIATGCGIGCLAMVVVASVVAYLGYRALDAKINEFAEMAPTEPLEIEYPMAEPEQVDQVIQRYDSFTDAISNSRNSPPLVLSADEINILIKQHPDFSFLSGRSMVEIENNQISSTVTINADALPVEIPIFSKAFRGRYINGKATVDFSVTDGKAELYLLDFKFGEHSLPSEVIDQLKNGNLLEDAESDEEFKKLFENLEELKVQDNRLHLVPKSPEVSPLA